MDSPCRNVALASHSVEAVADFITGSEPNKLEPIYLCNANSSRSMGILDGAHHSITQRRLVGGRAYVTSAHLRMTRWPLDAL